MLPSQDDCVSRLEAQMDDYIECEGRLQGCLSDGESGFEKLMEGGDAAEKEEEEILLHYGFLLLTLLLVVGFLFGYVLEKKHFTYVHEAGGHLLLGVFAGLVLSLMFGHSHESETGQQHEMVKVAKFDTEIFFLVLLPPIIFEAGYNMQRRKFFANIGAICMFAFIGTLVSTVLIAGTVFYTSQATGSATHGESAIFAATSDGRPFNGLESCIFGALISATDPVTVLAVFGAMGCV
jgi:NhaP-type Na+/H+ or K+/H+ antiporter